MVWEQGFLFSVESPEAGSPAVVAKPRRAARRGPAARANQPARPSQTGRPSQTAQAGKIAQADSQTKQPAASPEPSATAPTSAELAAAELVTEEPVTEEPVTAEPIAEPADVSAGSRAERLRMELRRLRGRGAVTDQQGEELVVSAGGEVLDRMLPHGGLRPGTLVEWVADAPGSGARLLATLAASAWLAHPASGNKPLVIADGWGGDESFYPPAAISLGIPAERMVVFRKPPGRGTGGASGGAASRADWNRTDSSRADLVWAIDQALRSGAVAGVLVDVGEGLGVTDARRLQLAAETGGAMLLCVRHAGAGNGSAGVESAAGRANRSKLVSVADVRWGVSSLAGAGGRRLRVDLVRCRGGAAGATRVIDIDPQGLPWEVPEAVATKASSGSRPAGVVSVRVREVRQGNSDERRRHGEAALVGDLVGRLADPASPGPAPESPGRRRVG